MPGQAPSLPLCLWFCYQREESWSLPELEGSKGCVTCSFCPGSEAEICWVTHLSCRLKGRAEQWAAEGQAGD